MMQLYKMYLACCLKLRFTCNLLLFFFFAKDFINPSLLIEKIQLDFPHFNSISPILYPL